jgi:single-strand DNA-binding protein
MAQRTVIGNLAGDPQLVQVGSVPIANFRVIENTGEFRQGKFVEHGTPTTHHVEAKFALGENVAASLSRGDAVIVVGHERTDSWGPEDGRQYGRVLLADYVGPSLVRATAVLSRTAFSKGASE